MFEQRYPRLAALMEGDEGWLDAIVRVEKERPLTTIEKVEADQAWAEFAAFMAQASPSATPSSESKESGSSDHPRPRKAGERSR